MLQNSAQNCTNFMVVIFQEQTRRGGPSGGLHICTKKRGFCVRARRGNERALRGGIGSVLSAPIFAPLRLAAASFSIRCGGLRQKKSPYQRAAEGLMCGVVIYGRAGRSTAVVGVSGLASDRCLQQCVRVEAHHVDPQPVV
jgi:hypothetical protein